MNWILGFILLIIVFAGYYMYNACNEGFAPEYIPENLNKPLTMHLDNLVSSHIAHFDPKFPSESLTNASKNLFLFIVGIFGDDVGGPMGKHIALQETLLNDLSNAKKSGDLAKVHIFKQDIYANSEAIGKLLDYLTNRYDKHYYHLYIKSIENSDL